MPLSQNRTKWPIDGGAIAVQPGWFTGHHTAFFYINMGFGDEPQNMSFPMLPVFQIRGPSRDPYPGTFCLPQVPLPVNATVKVGDNATIQIIETAIHGASLFNVSCFLLLPLLVSILASSLQRSRSARAVIVAILFRRP